MFGIIIWTRAGRADLRRCSSIRIRAARHPYEWSRSAPIFLRVPALLGNELHRMAAIQPGTLAGVPHV